MSEIYNELTQPKGTLDIK